MAHMSWHEACSLDPSLTSIASAVLMPVKVETVTGLTNLSWKLGSENDGVKLWRPVSDMTHAFNISRVQEFHVLQYLATQPSILSPKPILVNPQGLLVEWLDGRAISHIDDWQILSLMSQLHQLNVVNLSLVPFHYTARVDHYWFQLVGSPTITPSLGRLYQHLRLPPTIETVPLSLCHFDLGAHNLIQNHKGFQVIDWEYACLADPRIELAMLASESEQSIHSLVLEYCRLRNIEAVDNWILAVETWLPRVRLMALLWYLLAYQHKQEDQYLSDAHQILELLCRDDHCLLHENNQ